MEQEMKVLIIDPEIAEARGLKTAIERMPESGWSVRTAYSEVRAKKLLAEQLPELVIYGMENGTRGSLAFLSMLRELLPDTVLIITGRRLSEESFRNLLQLSVSDYLKKPVSEEALYESLRLAAARISAVRETAEELLCAGCWKQNAMTVQELFWKNLCLDRIAGGPEDIEEAAAQAGVELDKDCLCRPVLITLRNQEEMRNTWGAELCQAAIQNLARASVKAAGRAGQVVVIYTRVVILFDPDEMDAAEERLRLLSERCRNELGAEILCYIGEPVFYEAVAEAYKKLLSYSKDDVLNQNSITYAGERPARKAAEIEIPREWSEILYSADPKQLVREVERFLVPLAKKGQLSEKNFRIFQQDMLQLFFSYLEKKELQAHELYDNHEIYKLYQIAILSIEGMCRWTEACTEYITGLSLADGRSQAERTVGKIKDYIYENLKNEVTVAQIAQLTHLNADYATRLFKRRTGMTIKEYLIRKRMERAKTLLQTSEASVSEIAMETGYDNFSYFIRQFKKTYGVTPKQFRRSLQGVSE